MTRQRRTEAPWLIHFFRRSDGLVPARTFLDTVPVRIAAEIHAVLEAVATAPPPAFSGGGKWEVGMMHGDLAGTYEVRVRHGRTLFRLLCLLDREGRDLGGPSIVCLGGLSKASGTVASPRDYKAIRQYAEEFRRCRTVM